MRARLAAVTVALAGAACGGGDGNDDGDAAAPATGAPTEFCATVAEYIDTTERSAVFTAETAPGPDVLAAAFEDLRGQLDRLVEQAPADLGADMRLIATGTRDFIQAIEDADYDFSALAGDPEFVELSAEFAEPAYVDASDRLRTYAEGTCAVGNGG